MMSRAITLGGDSNENIARSIRLNTDLAKKPADGLEYLIVHELAHSPVLSDDAASL